MGLLPPPPPPPRPSEWGWAGCPSLCHLQCDRAASRAETEDVIGFLLLWCEGKGEKTKHIPRERMEMGQRLPNFVIKHCLFRIASWIGELSNQKLKKKKTETKNQKQNKKINGLLIISSSHDDKLRWVTNSNIGRGVLVCLSSFFFLKKNCFYGSVVQAIKS